MFNKLKTRHKIVRLQKQIAQIEQKRARSQAALVEAILMKATPADDDVDYFNRYTNEISVLRSEMHQLQKMLRSA